MQVRADILGHVQAEGAIEFSIFIRPRRATATDCGGANAQSQTIVKFWQFGEQAGAAGLINFIVEAGAGPAAGFLQALHAALHIEAPLGQAFFKA